MNFYQEINILPAVDIGPYFIWQKIFQQIHLVLVENKVDQHVSRIGLSFPDYDAGHYLLGCKLRLFSPERADLEKLNCQTWLKRLNDYLRCGEITTVPVEVAGYACFAQIKPRGSKEKLARRRAKRKGETLEQALNHYANYDEERSRLPYVNVVSLTNGNHFRLFIEKQNKEEPQAGFYSCYGLSRISTVPLF